MAIMIPLIPISAVLLCFAFIPENPNSIVQYTSYFVSAYTLTVWCFRIPDLVRFFKGVKNENRLILRYTGDPALRVRLSLYGTTTFNIAYAALQLGLGIYHHSVWFYSLAAYYALLSLMRFFLLRDMRANKDDMTGHLGSQWKKYRFCGVVLGLTSFALIIVVIYIMYKVRGFSHHEITTIALAAYTFTSFAFAIRNVLKYRAYKSPVMSAAKMISLASALVSVMTLENAMLNSFGSDMSGETYMLFSGLTGIAVCGIIIASAIFMIIRSTKELRKLNGK